MEKLIRDSTELPAYRNGFDPWQLETEQYLAAFLKKHANPDPQFAPLLAEMILRVVLGVFRPDKFQTADPEHLKSELREILDNLNGR